MAKLQLSSNPLFQLFAERSFCYATAGGADIGECLVTMTNIGEGNFDDWYNQWMATANRVEKIGDESLKNGHEISARESYLRASNYYHTAYMPLFGYPVDVRLKAAFEKEVVSFQKAAKLLNPPIAILEIPFENRTLPAYFIKADNSDTPCPTIVHVDGFDSNIQEMYFAHVQGAQKRGYNCLLVDGPGQGRNLIRDNISLRPDWENVIKAVVDYILTRTDVDSKRLVLLGWSLGGFLAPRAAAYEHRIAALVADPGQWDIEASLSKEFLEKLPNLIKTNPTLEWQIQKRGFWVQGVSNLEDFIKVMSSFKISDIAQNINCPTLITMPEGDAIAQKAEQLYNAIKVENKKLIHFAQSEGSGGHCEIMSRSLYYQRVFDWLDETLKRK